jgi:hypothetical protein
VKTVAGLGVPEIAEKKTENNDFFSDKKGAEFLYDAEVA